MKDKTGCIAIVGFVGLKPKMYSFLVDDNNEHKKAKGVNRNVAVTISHNEYKNGVNRNVVATKSRNEYKNVLLNNKCLRHSINRIQSKDDRIGPYKINKIPLSCFDDKIYIKKWI